MYNNNSFGAPMQGFNEQNTNPVPIPSTYMINIASGAPFFGQVISGGSDGPLKVNHRNPKLATNSRNLTGYICTTCGKGILLLDMDLVQNGKRTFFIFNPTPTIINKCIQLIS